MPQENIPNSLDARQPKAPVVDPLSGKSIEELQARRRELAEQLQGKKEGEDWKAELEFDLVQKAITQVNESQKETAPDEIDLLSMDGNVSSKVKRTLQ